jgi:phenylpropionate dioxygenase-like ring-hydroxylating dioxygenase large terminal subunit
MDGDISNDPRGIGTVAGILLDYAERGTTFQTDHIATVPARSFTDPDQWQREMATIFTQVPLMLAMSAEIREKRSYKAMEVMGKPVILTRDGEGQVHAFLNVCTHRGTPIMAEGCGSAARLTCPYHAWSFGLDGKLLSVSSSESFGVIDKVTRGLTRLPCVERAGMVFVVLTPGAPLDIDGYYGGLLADFEAADFANWAYLGFRVIEGANWKIAFDGYLEGYHFAALHPQTIHPRTYSNLTHYEAFGPNLRIGFAQKTIAEKLAAVPRASWGEQENNGFDFVRILFPNVSVFLAPEIAQIAQLFPGPTPDKNRTILLYARREPPRDEEDRASLDGMINFLRDVTHDEDYVLGTTIQKGLESGALDSIILGKNERGNQYFHEWVDWYVKGDAAAPKPRL